MAAEFLDVKNPLSVLCGGVELGVAVLSQQRLLARICWCLACEVDPRCSTLISYTSFLGAVRRASRGFAASASVDDRVRTGNLSVATD
jgi:hypothetical protein